MISGSRGNKIWRAQQYIVAIMLLFLELAPGGRLKYASYSFVAFSFSVLQKTGHLVYQAGGWTTHVT